MFHVEIPLAEQLKPMADSGHGALKLFFWGFVPVLFMTGWRLICECTLEETECKTFWASTAYVCVFMISPDSIQVS